MTREHRGNVGSAVISDCGKYRYELRRTLPGGFTGEVAWVMLNPSTADWAEDDATIRKVMGFSYRWGFGSVRVVNLYALRATDCRELKRSADPRGRENAKYVSRALEECDSVVLGWGRRSKMPDDGHWFVRERARGMEVKCLGFTKCHQPVHPLMIGYDRNLVTMDSENWGRL